MTTLGLSDNHRSFLTCDNPLFKKPMGDLAPQIIPYTSSACSYTAHAQHGNVSAICGFAALNYVRVALKLESEGVADAELLRRVISHSLIDETTVMTDRHETDNHKQVEELLRVPVFREEIVATLTLRPVPEGDSLRQIFSSWFSRDFQAVQAVVLSNSHETTACLHIPVSGASVYAIMDSHSRPHHPTGPAFTLTHQLDDFISLLRDTIFRKGIQGNDPDINKQFSAHMLGSTIYANKRIGRSKTLSESGNLTLAVSEHIALVRARSEQYRKTDSRSDSSSTLAKENLQPIASTSSLCSRRGLNASSAGSPPRGNSAWQLSTPQEDTTSAEHDEHKQEPMPSKPLPLVPFDNHECRSSLAPTPDSDTTILEQEQQRQLGHASLTPHSMAYIAPKRDISPSIVEESSSGHDDNWQYSFCRVLEISKSGADEDKEAGGKAGLLSKDDISWQALLAQQLQEEEEISALNFNNGAGEHAWRLVAKRLHEENAFDPQTPGFSAELDWQIAIQIQQEMDDDASHIMRVPSGDTATTGEISADATSVFHPIVLPTVPTILFECGICGEMHDLEAKMSLPGCGHCFCKDCLTNFTTSKIDDGRYPIFCPECIVERPRSNKSLVTDDIIKHLEIPQDKLVRLAELQMVAHAITLQCPRCKESMNIDKDQYAEEKIIVCPLPRCGHKWCKSCLKTLASSDDRHRCKNSNIDRLMRRKGWKYCPGCRTPVQKEAGCNHMTCGTPGCNVHFCYKCGVLMVDTTNGGDVGTAVTEHYMNCRLFERKLKCNIM